MSTNIQIMGSERKSNFELMRIIAMLMIVASHLYAHGVQHILEPEFAYKAWPIGNSVNRLLASLFIPGGGIGVALFFMLSGYFLVEKKHASIKKVFLESVFYCFFFFAVFFAVIICEHYLGADLGFKVYNQSEKTYILFSQIFIPFSITNWWFVSVYILLVIIAPLLNSLVYGLTKRRFVIVIILFWLLAYMPQLIYDGPFSPVVRAVLFYLMGAYYRKFLSDKPHKCFFHICIILTTWCLYSYLSFSFFNKEFDSQGIVLLGGLQAVFLVPLCAWSLFSLFAGISISSNAFINKLASLMFGVYLIHDSPVGRILIWKGILRVSEVQFSSIYFPLLAFIDIVSVFTICCVIDFFRKRFFEAKMMDLASRMKKRWDSL